MSARRLVTGGTVVASLITIAFLNQAGQQVATIAGPTAQAAWQMAGNVLPYVTGLGAVAWEVIATAASSRERRRLISQARSASNVKPVLPHGRNYDRDANG